uniref:CFAP91 domain-containing protein n=1 Tax=Macrostomum lignano TaxID=282301 RepID=A0A1I8FBM0_9PLAT
LNGAPANVPRNRIGREDSGISNESLTSHNTFLKRAHHQGYSMSQPETRFGVAAAAAAAAHRSRAVQPPHGDVIHQRGPVADINETPNFCAAADSAVAARTVCLVIDSRPTDEDGGRRKPDLRPRHVSVQTRRQMLAHSLAMLGHETRAKQKDLDRRAEVQTRTADFRQPGVRIIRSRDQPNCWTICRRKTPSWTEKEDELARLQRLLRRTLLEELGRSRQDIAQIRAKADEPFALRKLCSAAHAEKEAKRAQREALAMRESSSQELQASTNAKLMTYGDAYHASKKELPANYSPPGLEDKIAVTRRRHDALLGQETRRATAPEAGQQPAHALQHSRSLKPVLLRQRRTRAATSRWESLIQQTTQNDPKLADCVIEADSAAAAAAAH